MEENKEHSKCVFDHGFQQFQIALLAPHQDTTINQVGDVVTALGPRSTIRPVFSGWGQQDCRANLYYGLLDAWTKHRN